MVFIFFSVLMQLLFTLSYWPSAQLVFGTSPGWPFYNVVVMLEWEREEESTVPGYFAILTRTPLYNLI